VPISSGLALQPDPTRYTLPRFLEDVCRRRGDRTALRFEGTDLVFGALEARVRALARGLVGAGVVKGSRVALLFANRPEWVTAAFAVALAGGVIVPVSTFAAADERDYILRHGDASLLVFQRGLLGRDLLAELLAGHPELADGPPGRIRSGALPALRRAFCLGLERAEGGVEPWAALEASSADVSEALLDQLAGEVRPSDEAMIVYTSGSTARPKGVLHLQRAPVIQSWRFAEAMGLSSEDRVFTAQPFFWTAGFCMSLGASLAAGATLLLQETFDAEAALALIERERATTVHAWPHQEKAMAEHPSARTRDLSSVRHVEFTSPLAALAGLEKDTWGIYGSYGLSETFTVASLIPASAPPELRRRTHGRPLPGMTVRIVDPESGAPLPPGAKGEIAVKGLTLMRGYYKVDPEDCLDAEGFFRTGDGGFLDADGYLHWGGRLSNIIKTGGANVSPLEVESALTGYPGLRSAHAVGIPHPTLGEALVLCAVVEEGRRVDGEAIRGFLRERLAPYKVPRAVLAFAPGELPLTDNQKVQLSALREAALERLEEERQEIAGHVYGASG
jgi:fatty-acyl-CoA synthase